MTKPMPDAMREGAIAELMLAVDAVKSGKLTSLSILYVQESEDQTDLAPDEVAVDAYDVHFAVDFVGLASDLQMVVDHIERVNAGNASERYGRSFHRRH